MWHLSESCDSKSLKQAVMEFIDSHFEYLMQDHLLNFLNFDDIDEILSRAKLCIRSEKAIVDQTFSWIASKRCVDSEDDNELAIELIQKLQATYPNISQRYIQHLSANAGILIKNEAEDKVAKTCQNCFFLCMWSRDESEIRGLNQFLGTWPIPCLDFKKSAAVCLHF